MSNVVIWLGLVGLAIVVELMVGSLHFLMLALALAAGAIAAHFGASVAMQALVVAVAGVGIVVGWVVLRRNRPPEPAASVNSDVNMDIGGIVEVTHWAADGTATTHYRGANWAVLHRPNSAPMPGTHRVVEVVGSRLVVEKVG